MTPSVLITAPSRLHFGMFAFEQPKGRSFGGLGAMIDTPGLRLRVTRVEEFSATGPLAERALKKAAEYAANLGLKRRYRIEVLSAPPEHVGLGVGTQLAMSVGTGIFALEGGQVHSNEEIAILTGRGQRSAIGVHGFALGGLIADRGKLPVERIAPMAGMEYLPDDWRFVLFVPLHERGIHGGEESRAFEQLPVVPPETTERLSDLAINQILPAAREADFNRFSSLLFDFNHTAGLCFASFQHGAYANERVAALVSKIRSLGVVGVGQSSWGPTVFALAPDESTARGLIESFARLLEAEDCQLLIAAPNNRGFVIERS
jgi:beta-RFAP synthase